MFHTLFIDTLSLKAYKTKLNKVNFMEEKTI